MMKGCPFCEMPSSRVVDQTNLTFTVRDGYPVSEGHTLIIPKRYVGSFFDTIEAERTELMQALINAKKELDSALNPDSYNIGINDGPMAGQTVSHLHIHLIPRYKGDCDEPRGGVRWLFPDKANYWS